jgi:hypothetical protein
MFSGNGEPKRPGGKVMGFNHLQQKPESLGAQEENQ